MKVTHYKGEQYTVEGLALQESNPAIIQIAYRDKDGTLWFRPASEFFETVPDGMSPYGTTKRYAPVVREHTIK